MSTLIRDVAPTNRQMTNAVDVSIENERRSASEHPYATRRFQGNLPMMQYGLQGTLDQRFGTLLPMKLAKIAMNPYHGKIHACK